MPRFVVGFIIGKARGERLRGQAVARRKEICASNWRFPENLLKRALPEGRAIAALHLQGGGKSGLQGNHDAG